ncbi:MAG: hypothetical protein QOF78_2535 [Phycisphaerales bacterium]|jgi:hypothetical protein|nr:hypothetical protein [Phycisphaerales bacterium]
MPVPAPPVAVAAIAADRLTFLAGATGDGSLLPVFGWCFVLFCLFAAGFFAISKLQKWLKEDEDPGPAIGFTLSDLRALHKQGKMSDEEYERARAKMVAGAKALAAKLPDPLARDRKPPPTGPSTNP